MSSLGWSRDGDDNKALSKYGLIEGRSRETDWLLDDDGSNGVGSKLSRHESQSSKGLFTYFDDPHANDQQPLSAELSPVPLPDDQQFTGQSVALIDYFDATEDACRVERRTYTCFYLSAAAFSLLIASFGLSLWWSINHDDVSGGFGMGSYTLGVSTVIIAVASYVHSSSCRCWARRGAGDFNGLGPGYGHYDIRTNRRDDIV
ncbi:hypothetical protein F5Y05DRAFT_311326 [Hypoxylon sp. FL0543]|nr:hypothetical protein F5Y05DRAFT_311326 [Hypoxylon sp. FL0543]